MASQLGFPVGFPAPSKLRAHAYAYAYGFPVEFPAPSQLRVYADAYGFPDWLPSGISRALEVTSLSLCP